MGGREAARLGLVTECVEVAAAQKRAEDIAKRLAQGQPALWHSRGSCWTSLLTPTLRLNAGANCKSTRSCALAVTV